MNHHLTFTQLANYDAGLPGITVGVTLGLGHDRVNCVAKLDTGASFCIFARDVGERLGLDVEGGIRQLIGTVTGNFVAYLHDVNLLVAGFQLSVLVGFAKDETFQRNVLGRRGFLEQMRLGIVDYEGKLYLSIYDNPE